MTLHVTFHRNYLDLSDLARKLNLTFDQPVVLGCLGTIQILRKQVFGLFLTHPPSMYWYIVSKNCHFLNPPTHFNDYIIFEWSLTWIACTLNWNIWELWSFYQKLAKRVVKPNYLLPVGITTHLAKEGNIDLADKQKIG